MYIEVLALEKKYTRTWHLVAPSKERNFIDCKWVFRIKRKVDGSIIQSKVSWKRVQTQV